MAAVPEVLVEFDENIASDAGVLYHARALGVATAPSHWEGWLEFTPLSDGGVSVDTDRETTQPNRTDLLYWVTGLTRVYLQGALNRALARVRQKGASRYRPSVPTPAVVPRAPVLDPFAVYSQGENLLRQELRALSADHLETIVSYYELEPEAHRRVDTVVAKEDLAERIVAAVRRRATSG
jgi:hypothetical protein